MAFGSFGSALQSFANDFSSNSMFSMPIDDYFSFDYFPVTEGTTKKPDTTEKPEKTKKSD